MFSALMFTTTVLADPLSSPKEGPSPAEFSILYTAHNQGVSAARYPFQHFQKLQQISEYVEEAQLGCSLTNRNQSEEFFDFVLDNVLLPLARADVRSEIEPDSSIWDVLGPLRDYHNMGIKCLKGSNKGNMLVIQTVLEVYIDMLKLDLASVQEKILELEGVCPPGYELGDWSDGSGDCCCSIDVTLGDEDSRLTNERPANSSIEICYEKKACECRPCQKPCLVEKLTGLFASFDARATVSGACLSLRSQNGLCTVGITGAATASKQ